MSHASQPLRVQFIHGLESNPGGLKARALAAAFTALTPAMDTSDYPRCLEQQAAVLAVHRPDVLVGSSFGGALALDLLQRGRWRGPTLLLAPAALLCGLEARIPAGAPVWIVHGLRDDVVPVEHARRLAAGAADPTAVRLIEVDDGHRLVAWTERGELVETVRALASAAG